MATIKAYTTIEQSRKLCEILPLESADMAYWKKSYLPNDYAIMARHTKELQEGFESKGMEYIPCWSLAALFNIIPQEILGGDYIINITEGCTNKWILTYDHCENVYSSYYGLSSSADNLVDACYELILKLNERKML